MSHLFTELSARLARLKTEAGLSEGELWIVRTLTDTFLGGLHQLTDIAPSRRTSADFWSGQENWLADRVARTGSQLLGPAAEPADEKLFAPDGRLLAAEVLHLHRDGDQVAARSYMLAEKTARVLFTNQPDIDPEFLSVALQHLSGSGGAASEGAVLLEPSKDPLAGARRLTAALREHVPAPSEPPKRDPPPRRPSRPVDDPEATPEEALFDVREPEIGFEQVFLPADTLREIRVALVQIRKHPLLVERWGLGERYRMGRGLAFNFAGPAGTGKTLTAEAVARDLGRPLLTVKYSGLESKWIGETGKHIAAVFAAARRHEAVLFFDEADAIASRRTANIEGSGRHYNLSVNILLHELEQHDGVVIFATNLAANFDPAFERRIQSHVLFRIPEADEREKIWRAHLPPRAPLAPDLDLRRLAEDFEMAGGDIRNAVLKAVRLAALDDAPDEALCITQEHLLAGAHAVQHARTVMAQSILADRGNGGS